MKKIIVKNSCIEIHDYSWGDCPRIEASFSCSNYISHVYYYMGIFHDPDKKILYVPRGVDIWFVEQCVGVTATIDKDCDKCEAVDIKMKIAPRDDVQKQALRFMIGVLEYKYNADKSQLGLNLATGKGKSYVSIATCAYFQMKAIIIASSSSWLVQWKNYFLEYTNLTEKDICIISGSPKINKLIKDKNDYSIYLVTHSSINSYASSNGWDAVTKMFSSLHIGLKFFDEAHMDFKNTFMIDFFTNTYKTFYVTATPARSSEDEKKCYMRYMKNVPSIDLFDAEKDPHTKVVAIKYNSHFSPQERLECTNQYGLNRMTYANKLVNKVTFHKLLTIILDLCLRMTGQTIMYVGTNEAIIIVKDWVEYNFPELRGDIGIFTSIVSAEDKEKEKLKKLILSTTKSAGQAVDIKGLKCAVILAEPFKSEVLTAQVLGRLRNVNTFCIDTVDNAFPQTRRFYTEKKPVYDKYAVSVEEIVLNDIELDKRYKAILEKRGLCTTTPVPMITFNPVSLVSFEDAS